MIFSRKILLKQSDETPKYSRLRKNCPTQRACDDGESARFTGFILASGLYCSRTFVHAHPYAGNTKQ